MTTTRYEQGQALGPPTVPVDCCDCGINFAVPEAFDSARRVDHHIFWCPLGHNLRYPAGKTDLQIEIERRRAAEATATFLADQRKAEAKAHATTKGKLTKARKRAARGICPCCNRSFADVARHVATKHPEHLAAT